MEIRNIITFLRVAELLSFTKAAEELGYSQSAITVQIKQLEEELEVPLFERIGRQVALTDSGKEFISYANEIYKSVEYAKSFQTDPQSPKGTLRIGTYESIACSILPKCLIALHKAMPKIEISVKIATPDRVFEMLSQNEVDIACIVDRKVNFENYVSTFETNEKIYLVCGKDYPLIEKEIYSAEDIINEQFISTGRARSYNKAFEDFLAAKNLYFHPYLEIGNTDIIIEILKKGNGISLLPEYSVNKHIQNGDLRVIPVEDMDLNIYLQLIYNKNKWLTPQMQKFICIAEKNIKGEQE